MAYEYSSYGFNVPKTSTELPQKTSTLFGAKPFGVKPSSWTMPPTSQSGAQQQAFTGWKMPSESTSITSWKTPDVSRAPELFPSWQAPTVSQEQARPFPSWQAPTVSQEQARPFPSWQAPTKPLGWTMPVASNTVSSVEPSANILQPINVAPKTWVEKESFSIDPQFFKQKAAAVIAVNLALNSNKFDETDICIRALTKLKDEDLIAKCGGKTGEYLFVKTMYYLIDEIVNTREDLIALLKTIVSDTDLLVYALNLVKRNGASDALKSCTSPEVSSQFLAAYCYALECFLNNEHNPNAAIDAAKTAPTMRFLVTRLTASMAGASYGLGFLSPPVASNPAIRGAWTTLFG